ncbi:hypothetical protein [Streptomyces meridianus]|uniref:Uncharacterized protein n=1 Tax=Streptomyces meridianus TaxID=2938945 RepID=A0ABT0X781_9ACTN|nr:hypothetical protein [Streptomyces meridianus]MCM2578396.1 hypothetical protein [Streptomyces meridianus]
MRSRSTAAALGVLAVLVMAGCGTDRAASDGDGRPTGGSSSPGSSAKGPRWAYADVAGDKRGRFLDVTAPAADDMWATAAFDSGAGSRSGDQRLFHYDGRSWRQQDMPRELDGGVYSTRLASSGPDDVWLIGHGVGTGHQSRLHMARWDGSRWQRVPSKLTGRLKDVLVFGPDDVWVLAGEEAQHWDGRRWSDRPLPANASSMAGTSGDDVWAVGHRTTGPGLGEDQYSQPAAMHWDGRDWKVVDTPVFRFPDPQPPEASASLDRVLALPGGKALAYGDLSFNHGEMENEPQDRSFTLRWDGERWVDVTDDAPSCPKGRDAAPDGHGGLIHLNRWHLTGDGDCRRTAWSELPATGDITRQAQQSLWFARIVPVPGNRKLLGVGHMQVNQSGNPLSRPLIATLDF